MKDRFGIDWTGKEGSPFWKKPELSRRVLFRHVASAVGGYFLLPARPMETVARAGVTPMNRAKNVIFVLMAGAPSHVDTFDLKEGPWLPARFSPTTYGDNVRWPQGLMPKLAEQLSNICLVRSAKAWAGVHGLMQSWVQIGRNPTIPSSKISPHIGSIVSLEMGPQSQDRTLPAFMALNGNPAATQGYLAPEHGPFVVNAGGALPNTSHPAGTARFDTRYGLLQELDAEMRSSADIGPQAAEMAEWNTHARMLMYNSRIDKIFNLDPAERVRYGASNFGNACLTARNLVRTDMGTRFVQITFGSWDHHTNIYAANAQLTPMATQFDTGMANLMADLKNDGLLDTTLIVAMGEFGRTVGEVNAAAGRDHLQQQSVLFAGAGIAGNRTIGSTDARGAATVEPGWSGNRDVRDEDIEATIYSALGIDWTTIRHDDPLGRGFAYVPNTTEYTYGPLHELWG